MGAAFWKIHQGPAGVGAYTRHALRPDFEPESEAGEMIQAACGVIAQPNGGYSLTDPGFREGDRVCRRCFPPAPPIFTVGEVVARTVADLSACFWTFDTDGFYSTSCGKAFCFSTPDGPVAHGFRFCPWCGATLREVA